MAPPKSTARAGAASVVDKAGHPLADPPAKRRRHLEGLAYWFFYFPAVIVAMSCALLFIDLIERRLFNEDS